VTVVASKTIPVEMQAHLLFVLLAMASVVRAARIASSARKESGENMVEESFVPIVTDLKHGDTTEKKVAPLKSSLGPVTDPAAGNYRRLSDVDRLAERRVDSMQFAQPEPAMARAAPPGSSTSQIVQGGALRTWSYRNPAIDQVQVFLSSEGRPLDSDIELWHGPDNTPFKLRVYSENGGLRPFSAVLDTPRGANTISIRNIGQMEFPIIADVMNDQVDVPSPEALSASTVIQGGALRTFPFDPSVSSVEVLLTTDGRPLNARIELLQGPNNNKQVIELYSEDGFDRQFFAILETPGSGNVIRIINTAPIEFPMKAGVVPHSIDRDMGGDVVIGGSGGFGF